MKRLIDSRINRFVIGCIALATMVFIGWRLYEDWRGIKELIQQTKYGYFVLSFISLQASIVLFIFAWHLLISKLADANNLLQNLHFYCIANLGKNLPTPLWYIGGRTHLYHQAGYPRSPVVLCSLIELILHALTGLQILVGVQLCSPDTELRDLWILLALIPMVLILWKPKTLSLMLQWWRNRQGSVFQVASLSRHDLIQLIIVYSLTWINSLPFTYFIIRGWQASENISWLLIFQIWITSSLVGYIATILLGGAGFLREMSLGALLSTIMPLPAAIAVAASSRILLVIGESSWGAISFLINKRLTQFSETGTNK